MAVLVCGPVGHEAVNAYPSVLQVAGGLALAGMHVLRFDYPGSGDSSGHDDDSGRVDAWREAIVAAAAELRRLSGVDRIALFGIRLGGTLACEVAGRVGGVTSLVLWAAPSRGRDFVRELRLAGRPLADGALLVAGTSYSTETLRDLNAMVACAPGLKPAPRALVLGRDDLVRADPLPDVLRQAGTAVDERLLPGYAALLCGEATGALSVPALAGLCDWLRAVAPARQRSRDPAAGRAPAAPSWSDGVVRETVIRFGRQSLCGVLSAPEFARSPHTGVVLVSVGNNYRVGPHRLAVTTARALAVDGCRTLRFDLAGFGDSGGAAPGGPRLYDPASTADVQAAIDVLVQQGCRDIVLAGVCSGAYLAFQTALRDRRVGGIALVNARLLRWTGRWSGAGWEQARELNVRTLRSYRERLSKRVTWQRLLRGEFGVRWILRRLDALAVEQCRQLASRFPTLAGPTVADEVRGLCARGTRVLVLVGQTDDARGYVEYQFGRAGSRLRDCENFAMKDVVPGDHNFNGQGEPAALISQLRVFVAGLALPHGGSRPRVVADHAARPLQAFLPFDGELGRPEPAARFTQR
jgi:pimeloyl-ACP methyl ester carboxylesterase